MSENQAAWIIAPKAYRLSVQDAPAPKAGLGQVVLKSAAIAIVSLHHCFDAPCSELTGSF